MSDLTTLFQNTADAIRSKTGDTATMQASQFPAKIQGISVGISQDEADARYLQLSGGTMTGDLILNCAPTADNQAATKAYVDSKAGGLTLLNQKSITLTTVSSATLLSFSDIISGVNDYSKQLFLGVEFNGKAINNSSAATIALNIAYSDLLHGYTILQSAIPANSELPINHSGLIRIRLIPRYGEENFKLMVIEGYSSTIPPNSQTIYIGGFQPWQYFGQGTLTVKIYQM